jgi:hypothetical protein
MELDAKSDPETADPLANGVAAGLARRIDLDPAVSGLRLGVVPSAHAGTGTAI